MTLNAALVLMLCGLAITLGGWGTGVDLVLAGMGAVGLWFLGLLLR